MFDFNMNMGAIFNVIFRKMIYTLVENCKKTYAVNVLTLLKFNDLVYNTQLLACLCYSYKRLGNSLLIIPFVLFTPKLHGIIYC